MTIKDRLWRPGHWDTENIRLTVIANKSFTRTGVGATDVDMVEAGADAMYEALRLSGVYGTRAELAWFEDAARLDAAGMNDTVYLEQKGWLVWIKDENPDIAQSG